MIVYTHAYRKREQTKVFNFLSIYSKNSKLFPFNVMLWLCKSNNILKQKNCSKLSGYRNCWKFKKNISLAAGFKLQTRGSPLPLTEGEGRLSAVDLLELTSLDQLLLKLKTLFTFLQKKPNEELICTEPSPSICIPCLNPQS